MPFQYDPKDASNVWPVNVDYEAELMQVQDKVSKSSGNEMQEWTIKVYNAEGKSKLISEYVTANAIFKIKQLAIALNKLDDFNAGAFQADDYEGYTFMVELKIQEDDEYGDKNVIKKYKPRNTKPAPSTARPSMKEEIRSRQPARSGSPLQEELAKQPAHFSESDVPF